MKIGVLGYGSIGKRHYDNIASLGHSPTYFDPSDCRYGYRERMIDAADAIVVATPSKQHAHDLADALDAGKHVLVEKPFGYDCPPYLSGYLQGARLRHKDLIVATGFNLRFHQCVREVKKLLDAGTIGPLRQASFTVNQKTTKPPYLMDGIIRNWMSHEIDLAHYFFGEGEVTSCVAPHCGDYKDISECWMTMQFPTVEQPVYLQGDYYSDPEQRYFWIEGELGAIYCNLVRREVFTRMKGEEPRIHLIAADSWDENYSREMEFFISSILGQSHKAPLATGEDGVRTLYSVMAAREKAGLKDGA